MGSEYEISMKSFSYYSKVQQRLKKVKFNPNYTHACWVCRHVAKLCIHIMHKNSPKRNVIKDNYHSNKFLNYFLVVLSKFLNGILSSIWKVISPTWDSIFLLFEKAKYFCGKNISTEEFWHDVKFCYLGCLLL